MNLNRVKILVVFLLLFITLSNCGKKDVSVTDTSSCDKLFSDNEANKYACYTTLATSKKDVTVCDKIPEGKSSRDSWKQTWKDGCYSKVASSLKDKSICEKIKTQLDKDNCYKDLATIEKDYDRPKNEGDLITDLIEEPPYKGKKVKVSYNKRQFYDRILTPMKSMGLIDYDLYKKTYNYLNIRIWAKRL